MPGSLPSSGVGLDPQVASAQAVSPFRIRVDFTEYVTVDSELLDAANYTVTAGGGSVAVTPIRVIASGDATQSVVLVLNGAMTPGTGNYTVEVTGSVTDLAGDPLDTAADSATFDGYPAPTNPTKLTSGLLAGLTSAIGDELNDLSGQIATKLSQPLNASAVVQSGAGLRNASSVDSGVTVTLGSGTFSGNVQPGQMFRLLTGGTTVRVAEIGSVESTTQIILLGTGIGENFTNFSWQVETKPADTAIVESTIGFPDSGRFSLGGVQYRYASKSPDSLHGLEHLDEELAWVAGAKIDHLTGDDLEEISTNFSGTDLLWRSIQIDYASGADLDVIGTNLGVLRPPALTDALYREIIKIVAYSPRGTELVIRRVLDAIVGDGNYDILEDLTGARDIEDAAISHIRNPARVYIRVDRNDEELVTGKTFVERGEYAVLASTLDEFDLDPVLTRDGTTRLIGVSLPSDPLPEGIIVDRGICDITVTQTTGTATGATGAFSTRILSGDVLRIDSGPLASRAFIVNSRVSSTELDLDVESDMVDLGRPDTGETLSSRGAAWTVIRPWSDIGRHLPSAELEETYPNSGVYQAGWEWTGTAAETPVSAVLQVNARGRELRLRNATPSETITYRRRCRILPQSRGFASLSAAINVTAMDDDPNSGDQLILQIDNGDKLFRVGFIRDTTEAFCGFIDATGAFIGTPPAIVEDEVRYTFTIVIDGDQAGQLYVGDRLVDQVAYSALPNSAGPAVDPPGITFGGDSTTFETPDTWVSRVAWKFDHDVEFGALSANADVTAPRTITDLDGNGLIANDARFTIQSWSGTNSLGGTLQGHWEIDSAGGPNTGTFVGPTYVGARTSIGLDSDIIYLDACPDVLKFPHARGHQIELLDGPNAGVYSIQALLDAALNPVAPEGATSLFSPTGLASYKAENPGAHTPFEVPVLAVRVSDPPVGGFSTALGLSWRIIPVVVGTWSETIVFPNGATETALTVTLPAPVPLDYDVGVYEPIVACRYYFIPSAQVQDSAVENAAAGMGETSHYPFYLYDSLGAIRDVIDILTAGGVIPVYNQLARDESGLHIRN